MHEKQLHVHSWFLTLTYSDENLPVGNSLNPRDVTLFLKRLRKLSAGRIKYFYCGEYGDTTERPHYHMILYGRDFPDRKIIKRREKGDLYDSEELKKIWKLGNVWIGAVTPQSCAYTARYIMKKVTGEKAKEHYETVILATGEIIQRYPEFIRMSLKSAIAKEWYDKFHNDVHHRDVVVVAGKEGKPPRYYDKLLEKGSSEALQRVKATRIRKAKERAHDNTPERLKARKACITAKLTNLKRDQI